VLTTDRDKGHNKLHIINVFHGGALCSHQKFKNITHTGVQKNNRQINYLPLANKIYYIK